MRQRTEIPLLGSEHLGLNHLGLSPDLDFGIPGLHQAGAANVGFVLPLVFTASSDSTQSQESSFFEAVPTRILLVMAEKNRVKFLGSYFFNSFSKGDVENFQEISISLLKQKTGEEKGEVSLVLRI